MKYDIAKPQAPKVPTLGKGTECIKILLSQASKEMHEPLVPMLFPPLGAHMSQLPVNSLSAPCLSGRIRENQGAVREKTGRR